VLEGREEGREDGSNDEQQDSQEAQLVSISDNRCIPKGAKSHRVHSEKVGIGLCFYSPLLPEKSTPERARSLRIRGFQAIRMPSCLGKVYLDAGSYSMNDRVRET
jgi:hypothetical protein